MSDLGSCFKIENIGSGILPRVSYHAEKGSKDIETFDQHSYAETVAKLLNVTKTSMIPTVTGVKLLSKEDGRKPPKKGENYAASHTGRQWGP